MLNVTRDSFRNLSPRLHPVPMTGFCFPRSVASRAPDLISSNSMRRFNPGAAEDPTVTLAIKV